MTIRNCMKTNVFSIRADATLADAARLFIRHHVGLLPVVDETGKPIGTLGLRDMISMALPAFVQMVENFDFVHDFGAVEETRPTPEALNQPVTSRMGPIFSVPDTCGLLRAYALMLYHKLHDLPVIDGQGRLVGIASRVDLGTAILASWRAEEMSQE